jgi:hypothetical protein
MTLLIQNNDVEGNGGTLSGVDTGLVLRVGTSNSTGTAGGGGSSPGEVFNGSNGGVNAIIDDNFFSGNAGNDVSISSFTSTEDLAKTTGTWNATTFPATTLLGDPLARLNLEFKGNTGDEADVTQLGASYNNAEEVFKSRLKSATDPGPFTSATRRRNAQRLGSNTGIYAAPVTPAGHVYYYPGVGDSTFRVTSDSDTSGFGTADGFGDTVNYVGAIANDELPFGWATVAPGSFTFP